ncbi:hypothetical protein MGL_0061 [Malassezia globosa CBS 7966]|uniref:phosphoserine transaminase n=1 Tax=Malassezia globosa (strain ATCC MYA-4612 / CBS 7966) TaxID=425265 RepID=A8PRI6_MALGO|nr:uncharacterized protein MGL_0061 [Malassezia globosa CBS 7966]EDP45072.1 hypothetical protein MGL_0061 [Malassezia globosa CBS 7966]
MSTTPERERTVNLGAGPSKLSTDVVLEASKAFIDYQGLGIGVAELSHRSDTFKTILANAENDLRKLLDIPDNYAVLFMQGGGTEQFSSTLLNMLAAHAAKHGNNSNAGASAPPVDYVVSGAWSKKAVQEARRLTSRVNVASDMISMIGDPNAEIPSPDKWQLSPVDEYPAMLYYCENETIHGFEFPEHWIQRLPQAYRERVPIVADCSSNILSRPIDVRAHGVIFFGAQKNVGPSGVTMVIVRRDLIVDPDALQASYVPPIPATLVYKNMADNGSLYNTPPTFSIYVSGIGFRKLLLDGGVPAAQERARIKSELVYKTLDVFPHVYRPTVAHPAFRSKMNLTFRVLDRASGEPSPDAEKRLVAFCREHHVVSIQGHRSVGGIRASLYNSVTIEEANKLASLLKHFAEVN